MCIVKPRGAPANRYFPNGSLLQMAFKGDFKALLSFKVWAWAWEGVELQTTMSDSVTASHRISTRSYVTTAFSSSLNCTFNLRSAATGTPLHRSKSNLTATRLKKINKRKKKDQATKHLLICRVFNVLSHRNQIYPHQPESCAHVVSSNNKEKVDFSV